MGLGVGVMCGNTHTPSTGRGGWGGYLGGVGAPLNNVFFGTFVLRAAQASLVLGVPPPPPPPHRYLGVLVWGPSFWGEKAKNAYLHIHFIHSPTTIPKNTLFTLLI